MSELNQKLDRAECFIRETLAKYSAPVVMASFGKDSMVMLDILHRVLPDRKMLPIVFHREPFNPLKYDFANKVIRTRNYAVYDYAPAGTRIVKNGANMEIVNFYQVGDNLFNWMPTGIREYDPEDKSNWTNDFLCGFRDLYNRPVGGFQFPWDLGFIGHKSTDVCPILGAVPLQVDIKVNENGPDYCFPLRYFTDTDIWEYIERFHVPYNTERYDKANGYKEFADITYNHDYHITCTRCIDPDGPEMVQCPLSGTEIPNRKRELRYTSKALPSYVGGAR